MRNAHSFILVAVLALALGWQAPAKAQTVYAQALTSCGQVANAPVAGNVYPMTTDLNGQLCTEGSYLYSHLAALATTTVKTGPGALHSITLNTCIASATVTVYDNTSAAAPVIATLTCPATVTNPVTLIYDARFSTGLTVVLAGTGAPDVTVAYR